MDIDQKLNKFLESIAADRLERIESHRIANLEMKEIREGIAELRKSQAETSLQIQELRKSQAQTDEQMKKSDAKLERMGERLGNMGIANGFVAEEFFFRSLQVNPRLGFISFDIVQRRNTAVKGHTDYDIFMKNGTSIGLIEVKYNAHAEKVKEIMDKKIQQFRGQYPEYQDYQLYFGLASMITNNKLIENAKKEGIFLLTQKGEHLEVVNQEVRSF